MKIFSTTTVNTIDAYTIKHEPIRSIDLMERASKAFFDEFRTRHPYYRRTRVFVGPGNNGGDALALCRMLANAGYEVSAYILSAKMSEDAKTNLERLESQNKVDIVYVKPDTPLPMLPAKDVVVDGIFGSGLSRPAEGFYAQVIQHINASGCPVVSIDIPSGLFGQDNRSNTPDTIIKATCTLTFQFPKLAFFFANNEAFVGRWKVLDIGLHPRIIEETASNYYYITKQTIQNIKRQRMAFAHKGHFGHGLLIAGSYGKMGASVLAAKAALKSGIGLLTVQAPHVGYTILQTAVPEAMVHIDRSEYIITEYPQLSPYNAIGIGPGIGTNPNTRDILRDLLLEHKAPMVVDADALNLIAEDASWLHHLPAHSIITPHPKEFDRLAGESSTPYDRHLKQLEMAQKHNIYIVLKGAHTAVATPEGICCFNSTGNAGMATAGSGDVLTGIITSLLAQGYTSQEAAILGVWVHGRAGDIYADAQSQQSLTASDIINNLGQAFKELGL